ncbi:MAG: hypothetical protein H2064_03165 [Candidatus Dadabacteria bacterium]|jgi:hypothetical protein|nr:hypothetical protein [Candidatus Dadabacteria bacterium]
MTILYNKKFKTKKPSREIKLQKKLVNKKLKIIKNNTISTSVRTLLMY